MRSITPDGFGETMPPDAMDVERLLERTEYIRESLRVSKVRLKEGEGLALALARAEAVAQSRTLPGDAEPGANVLSAIAHDAHVLWALADNLKTCRDAGLDVTAHLKQITTGSIDYGTPAAGHESARIYFKDFELELFIAAHLRRGGVASKLADPPNDPLGDLVVGSLRAEVKHPNSLKQLVKLAAKFQKALTEAKRFGAFVVGLEDAFELGAQPKQATYEDHAQWHARKRDEMEAFGRQFIESVVRYDRIIATVQTSTIVERFDGASQLVRLGNSLLLDDGRCDDDGALRDAESVAKVFNPDPRRLSKLGIGAARNREM